MPSQISRVALAMDASIDYGVLLHALVRLGAVAVPLDPRLAPAELADRLSGVESALVVRDPADVLDAPEVDVPLDGQVDLDAVHCILHTSGSGGRARAVELTYGNHLWSALGSGSRIGVDPRDLWLCCLPLHHVGGLAILVWPVLLAAPIPM